MPDRALAEQRRATALDPLAPINYDNTGDDLHYLGRDQEAIAASGRRSRSNPTFVFSLKSLCVIDADIGKLDDARQILRDRLLPLDGEKGSYSSWCKAAIAFRGHDQPELKRIAQDMEQAYAGGETSASQVGYTYALAAISMMRCAGSGNPATNTISASSTSASIRIFRPHSRPTRAGKH